MCGIRGYLAPFFFSFTKSNCSRFRERNGKKNIFLFVTNLEYICEMKYIVLFSLFLASCWSPKQRYDRLIMKYPDLIETDTVIIKDTLIKTYEVPVKEFSDSFIIQHDTIIETKQLIITRKGNSFGVKVKPDTIIFRDTISYQVKVPGRVFIKKEFNPWWLLVAFLCGMILAYRLRP